MLSPFGIKVSQRYLDKHKIFFCNNFIWVSKNANCYAEFKSVENNAINIHPKEVIEKNFCTHEKTKKAQFFWQFSTFSCFAQVLCNFSTDSKSADLVSNLFHITTWLEKVQKWPTTVQEDQGITAAENSETSDALIIGAFRRLYYDVPPNSGLWQLPPSDGHGERSGQHHPVAAKCCLQVVS
jgi:hypothetical protein